MKFKQLRHMVDELHKMLPPVSGVLVTDTQKLVTEGGHHQISVDCRCETVTRVID